MAKAAETLTTHVVTATRTAACAAVLCCALGVDPSRAGENISGFTYLDNPTTETTAETFGPTSSNCLSIANVAPVLLPYVNNGPVFGLPGTIVGDISERTQLTGDWGGQRTALAEKGVFMDVYTTFAYQSITSGGLDEVDASINNVQISINVDTGRAGLWRGGVLHFTAQGRTGSSFDDQFAVGSSIPQYLDLLLPGAKLDNDIYPSDFYLLQSITPKTGVIVGVINGLYLPDQTLFGDAHRYAFTNFSFNKNPLFANFFGPTAVAALGAYAPSESLVFTGGVLDPYTVANDYSDTFDAVNLYGQATFTYSAGGRPGQVTGAVNWTNQEKLNLDDPFEPFTPLQIAELLTTTDLSISDLDLSLNNIDSSYFAIGNFSQYLLVKDDPTSIKEKLKSGQQLRGLGLFGRFGYAPEKSNVLAAHASLALYGRGLSNQRPIDSFGAGVYYNRISRGLTDGLSDLTLGAIDVDDEVGIEAFYDFALTPAVRLIASYQWIQNPLLAQVVSNEDHANVFFARISVAW
ncbi:carbohydrate porin [Microbulbifer sp. SAOS-129_SWC]|uniref:carbohydrate porin n=1 Tax=Microbulbifer sp. SAOS-129_SWC TaxID=3145235 RepID=UPI0032167D68